MLFCVPVGSANNGLTNSFVFSYNWGAKADVCGKRSHCYFQPRWLPDLKGGPLVPSLTQVTGCGWNGCYSCCLLGRLHSAVQFTKCLQLLLHSIQWGVAAHCKESSQPGKGTACGSARGREELKCGLFFGETTYNKEMAGCEVEVYDTKPPAP